MHMCNARGLKKEGLFNLYRTLQILQNNEDEAKVCVGNFQGNAS